MSEPMRWIPEASTMLTQSKISLDRPNAFLLDDELRNIMESNKSSKSLEQSLEITCVQIQGGNFREPKSAISALRDVGLEVKRGQKIVVYGQVGDGKSTFLCAILGEVYKIPGSVSVTRTIVYVAQAPWIKCGTIRDNILFGKPMEKTKYEMVTKACALDKNINRFGHGDLTEIGQRGINLSSVQKQRIQIARAVYNDTDIYPD